MTAYYFAGSKCITYVCLSHTSNTPYTPLGTSETCVHTFAVYKAFWQPHLIKCSSHYHLRRISSPLYRGENVSPEKEANSPEVAQLVRNSCLKWGHLTPRQVLFLHNSERFSHETLDKYACVCPSQLGSHSRTSVGMRVRKDRFLIKEWNEASPQISFIRNAKGVGIHLLWW